MSRRIACALLGAALLLPGISRAAETYVFDRNHTHLMWFVSHFGFSESMGKFMDYDGKVVLDRERPENSSAEVTISAASIMTGLPKFDEHLKSRDFLNTDKFPTARFASTRVEAIDMRHARVLGDFTLMGVTRPLTLDVTLNKLDTNPYTQKQTAGFDVSASFKRSDFGMTYGLPGVGDEVKILVKAEVQLAESGANAPNE